MHPGTLAGFLLVSVSLPVGAQGEAARRASFDFRCGGKSLAHATALSPATVYSPARGYGFRAPLAGGRSACASEEPFLFEVAVPEGSYDVTVTIGDPSRETLTTVKAESRRLMLEGIRTRAGEFVTRTFTVNVRTPAIAGGDSVRLKPREVGSATWDERLTLEFNGLYPAVRDIRVRPARNPVTVFLAGNSTVTDQMAEPYAAWGQMIPRFFEPSSVVIANHAESGETLKSFVGERRLAKVLSTIKPGDYLFIEFAHNDQKPGAGYLEPFTTYKDHLRRFISEARARGATPVLVTSMHRRRFDSLGVVVNTLGDYPAAVRQIAEEKRVALIDLNAMSKQFYEALGPERSKKAFIHHPVGTYPGQATALEDDTHFSNYGAYELARMVVEGLRRTTLPVARFLRRDIPSYDPSRPGAIEAFALPPSPRR